MRSTYLCLQQGKMIPVNIYVCALLRRRVVNKKQGKYGKLLFLTFLE